MNKTVKAGQGFLDKVVELTGNRNNAFEMCVLNGISMTAELEVGSTIEPTGITNNGVVAIWNDKNQPATALTDDDEQLTASPGGIGFMSVGGTFIVS